MTRTLWLALPNRARQIRILEHQLLRAYTHEDCPPLFPGCSHPRKNMGAVQHGPVKQNR